MKEIERLISSWPTLSNGLHYHWMVDYPAYSAYGTYELSANQWANRDLIQNFKGNSELTTEQDHEQAVLHAIDLVSEYIKKTFGEHSKNLALLCIPAARKQDNKRRFEEFTQAVCLATGMENTYDAISYPREMNEEGEPIDRCILDTTKLEGKNVLLFDDIIASGGSITRFSEAIKDLCHVVGALTLAKKISDGYDK